MDNAATEENEMTKHEATEYIRQCDEDEGPENYEEAAEIFEAIFGRAPEADDGTAADLFSHACAAVG